MNRIIIRQFFDSNSSTCCPKKLPACQNQPNREEYFANDKKTNGIYQLGETFLYQLCNCKCFYTIGSKSNNLTIFKLLIHIT